MRPWKRQALDAEAGRWYLFGAQAAIVYGSGRLTADIAATVEIPVERAGELTGRVAGWASALGSATWGTSSPAPGSCR